MSFDVNNIPELVKDIGKTAIIAPILHFQTHILVLGEVSAGKTTLISACIGQPIAPKAPATTIKFRTIDSSITEITGLFMSNKDRGQVWKAVIEFIAINNTDIIWFCVGSDFVDSNDELWHWLKYLSEVCHVILVRTKSLSPSQVLGEDVAQKLPTNTPPVVPLLARDIQLNPKGGGAVVESYGVEDLISATEHGLKNKKGFTKDAIAKLQKQAKKDEERYASEEAQKGVILNSLRSLSGTDESEKPKGKSKNESLGDEDFEFVPRPESPGSGFVHMVKSKGAAVGVLVAFAVLFLFFL